MGIFRRIGASLLALIIFLFAGQMTVLGGESDNVKDSLNLLKEEELRDVQSLIEGAVRDYNLDVVIVMTDDTKGKSSMEFADDYYDYNGFGVGEDYSGLLMLINMKEREIWISTTGRAIDIYTDTRISDMVSAVGGFLSNGDYYNGCKMFVSKVRYYAEKGVPIGQYRVDTGVDAGTYPERIIRQIKSIYVYITAAVIALIATIIVSLSSKGKVTINNLTYEEEGSFLLTATADDYLREMTTRVKIESSSGGGSRSSTHRGGSGRTHGGGGGRF